jgi:hypothetical protein
MFFQLQLIDKDPSRAVSLFWAAINAGDRVDSALKDMSIVMKQLDRSDEAIEAIKSFRHLCPHDSQDSLDNVLIELYKVKVPFPNFKWLLIFHLSILCNFLLWVLNVESMSFFFCVCVYNLISQSFFLISFMITLERLVS